MTRQEIIEALKTYFSIKELTCNHVYDTFGEKAWQFLSTSFLHTLLVLRTEIFKAPIKVNNGKNVTQRGLRCNLCDLVKSKTLANKIYMSSHILGEAVDFDVEGYSAEEARQRIIKHANLLPYPIRLEKDVNWVHVDLYDNNNTKIYLFSA